MATSTCSLKPCLGCCEGHDSEERHDDGCDDTIIKAEHSSSLGFLNSEDPGTPQSDRLREWKEGETEQADVTGAEALDLSGVRIESDEASRAVRDHDRLSGTVSHSTMSYLSVPPTSTTRRQSIVEVAGAATRQSRRPSMTEGGGSFRSSPRNSMRESWCSYRLRKMISSKSWEVTSLLVVFCALFLTDILLLAQVPESTSLDIMMMGCFIFFVLELVANSLVTEKYINSFFFWMDIFGTASLVFDISFFLGVDATEPVRYGSSGDMTGETAVIARASRAAKQAARASRLSRILKLVRFLPFLRGKQQKTHEVANAVSMTLTTMLATRVAFLSVCIVIAVPLFSTFIYPEEEDSLMTWAILLSNDVDAYYADPSTSQISWINAQLDRLVQFYKPLFYGPFGLCIMPRSQSFYNCSDGSLPGISLSGMTFSEPRRAASIAEVEYRQVLLLFTLESVRQYEALSNLCLMFTVLLLMLLMCFLMNSSVNNVVLRPLQRVVTVLRQHCADIMKINFEVPNEEVEARRTHSKELSSDGDEKDQEVELLEKVLVKIVHIFETSVPVKRQTANQEEALFLDNFAGPVEEDTMQAPIMTLKTSDEVEDNSAGISPEMRKQLDRRTLNVFQVSEEQQRALALHVMTNTRSCRRWLRKQGIRETLKKFIAVIQSRYQANPFHNFGHGLDVLSELRVYLHSVKSYTILSEVTVFWLLVAALGHDVSHLGVNNQFLVETSHALALRYNDKSILENLHCAVLFEVLSDASANVLKVLDKAEYKAARAGIVEVILGTDMVRHNEDIKGLSIAFTMNEEAFVAASEGSPQALSKALQEDSKVRLKVLGAMLHTADISNPMKPWDLCEFLADKCLEEFFAQGDQEKELGIPVQMLNDRDKVNRCTSQVGFIEFVITPLAEQMVAVFPSLNYLTRNLSQNVQTWAEIWKTRSDPSAEEVEKLQGRVAKVMTRCKAGAWDDAMTRQDSATSGLSESLSEAEGA